MLEAAMTLTMAVSLSIKETTSSVSMPPVRGLAWATRHSRPYFYAYMLMAAKEDGCSRQVVTRLVPLTFSLTMRTASIISWEAV